MNSRRNVEGMRKMKGESRKILTDAILLYAFEYEAKTSDFTSLISKKHGFLKWNNLRNHTTSKFFA